MRVLDIDMDFFLSRTCPFAPEKSRPADACAAPWSENDVRAYLENNLRLSRAHRIPGRTGVTHDEAALYWRELAREGRLALPFEITHVDAHSDLGIAQRGYPFVKHTVLSRPVEKRAEFAEFRQMGQLNEANYLMFVLGARMADRLVNVRNPASKPDLPSEIFESSHMIRLASAFPALFEPLYGKEPAVSYAEFTDPLAYKAGADFDFAFAAQSPRYAPASADFILEIIKEYISED